jgi:FAD/FMN-containing dehydrogenase
MSVGLKAEPATVQEVSAELVRASARGEKGVAFTLGALARVLEYTPEDMTVAVEAGITLAALQERLAQHGQWLPIDPPNPTTTTVAEILNFNASGPRRFGYGTIREHLLGITVVLADGRIIHGGGKVVKNVAGYDLCKLFVGSRGSLGVIVEATFKVRPVSETERFVAAHCGSLAEADALLEAIHRSQLRPAVLDLHNLALSPVGGVIPGQIVLGLAGTREEVEWQWDKARAMGLTAETDLHYEQTFWNATQAGPPQRISVLPSRLTVVLQNLGASEFVARAGNGVIDYRGGTPPPPPPELPQALMRRIKDAYDPKHLFPVLS